MIGTVIATVALGIAPIGQVSDRYIRNFIPVGRSAPDFELPGLKGRNITLRGREDVKASLIVFWSLGGSPNLPILILANSLNEKHRETLRVIAINHADNKEQVQQFWSSHDLKIPCGLNQPPQRDVAKDYGVAGYPSVYILDGKYNVSSALYNPKPEQILSALSSLGIS